MCTPDKCPQCGLDILLCRCPNLSVEDLARHLFAREGIAASFDEFGFDAVLPYYARAATILAMHGTLQ